MNSGTSIQLLVTLALITIAGVSAVVVWRALRAGHHRLLWHVRRKLTLSYVFVGLVPVILLVVFFALSGLLLFFNLGSYLVQSRVNALVDETRFLAEAATIELEQTAALDAAFTDVLHRRQEAAAARYRGASYALVPIDRLCGDPAADPGPSVPNPIAVGPWAHLDAPAMLPRWVQCEGYGGLIAYVAAPSGPSAAPDTVWRTHLVARAVALPADARPRYAVIVDVPLSAAASLQVENETGIQLGDIDTVSMTATSVGPVPGRAIEEDPPRTASSPLDWIAFLGYQDWDTGQAGNVGMTIKLRFADIYTRISATPITQIGQYTLGQLLLLALATVGTTFLVVQVVAFTMGVALARSITGAVHELNEGTDYVRRGDFSHRIAVESRDQLGDLADSFNAMTASVEVLLREKAEKERLEQELRVARQIQMSLLPQEPLRVDGLSVSAHCEPARQVGGDYFDYFELPDGRVGIIIADVAGKGTSAALYMAELKGLMLSLSQLHRSPRDLLIAANTVIARHLDARSFITMTYVVIDVEARTMTHARAGHCPLLYLPRRTGDTRAVQVLAPDGLVLGLRIDSGAHFTQLLREEITPLQAGDLVLLYTDGIVEAMNADGEPFGEERLVELMRAHGDAHPDRIREKMLVEIRRFVGSASPHDDMTLVLIKLDERTAPADT